MKTPFILTITILFTLYITAQNRNGSKIIGKVVYLNSYKKPAVGVEITAHGSNGDTSKDDGSYKLDFPQLNIGATVFPKIGTEIVIDGAVHSIELVNTEKLEYYNIAEDATKAPLKIIVCPKGFRDEAAKRYYKIIRTETSKILKEKEIEIEVLKEKYGSLSDSVAKKIYELNRLQEQHIDTTLTYKKALNIASINRDDASDRVNNYLNALNSGKNIEEALKELSTKKAYLEAIQGGENIDASLNEIEREAKELIKIYKFDEAINKYDTISKILKNKRYNPRLLIDNLFVVSNLCGEQYYYTKAENYYNEILNLYKTKGYITTDYTYTGTLNNLASLQQDKNEYNKAENNYNEALTIYRNLAKNNPNTFLPHVATTLNNLANLQKNKNEYNRAENNYNEALTIRRNLAKKNPNTFLPFVAGTLNNLAILHQDKYEYNRAGNNYNEALKIYRNLAKNNPNTFLPFVAGTLNNLANLQKDKNEFKKAENNYNEALTIRRNLAKNNPNTFLPDVALTLNNLASLQHDKNEFNKAENNCNDGLTIYKNLAKNNPNTFLPDVAMTMNNLAIIQKNKNQYNQAENNFNEALIIYKNLAMDNPSVYNIGLARTYIPYAYLKKEQLQANFNKTYIVEGLNLINHAKEALNIYVDNHPEKTTYLKHIQSLEDFFNTVSASSIKFSKLKNTITVIKEKINNENNPSDRVNLQKEIIKNITIYNEEHPENKETISILSKNYGSLAWYALFNKDFVLAEQSAQQGLKLAQNNEWINTNLTLAYVLQNKYNLAKPIYTKLKDKPYGKNTYKTVFLEDIAALEKSGITHLDFERVKALLKN